MPSTYITEASEVPAELQFPIRNIPWAPPFPQIQSSSSFTDEVLLSPRQLQSQRTTWLQRVLFKLYWQVTVRWVELHNALQVFPLYFRDPDLEKEFIESQKYNKWLAASVSFIAVLLFYLWRLIQDFYLLSSASVISTKHPWVLAWICFIVVRLVFLLIGAAAIQYGKPNPLTCDHILMATMSLATSAGLMLQTAVYEASNASSPKGVLLWCFQPLSLLEALLLMGTIINTPTLARHALWYSATVCTIAWATWIWRYVIQKMLGSYELISWCYFVASLLVSSLYKLFCEIQARAEFLDAKEVSDKLSRVIQAKIWRLAGAPATTESPPAHRVLALLQLVTSGMKLAARRRGVNMTQAARAKFDDALTQIEQVMQTLMRTTDLYVIAMSQELDDCEKQWWEAVVGPNSLKRALEIPAYKVDPNMTLPSQRALPTVRLLGPPPFTLNVVARNRFAEDLDLRGVELHDRYNHSTYVEVGTHLCTQPLLAMHLHPHVAANLFWFIKNLHFDHLWSNSYRSTHIMHLGIIFAKVVGLFDSVSPALKVAMVLACGSWNACAAACHQRLWVDVSSRTSLVYKFDNISGHMRVSAVMRALSFKECDVFRNIPRAEQFAVRKCIAHLLLLEHKDHISFLWRIRMRYRSLDWNPISDAKDRGLLCELCMRTAELSGSLETTRDSWSRLYSRKLEEYLRESDFYNHICPDVNQKLTRDPATWAPLEAVWRENVVFPLLSMVAECQTRRLDMNISTLVRGVLNVPWIRCVAETIETDAVSKTPTMTFEGVIYPFVPRVRALWLAIMENSDVDKALEAIMKIKAETDALLAKLKAPYV